DRCDEIDGECECRTGIRTQQCGVLHRSEIRIDPGMGERGDPFQDLDQVLSSELAGSTAGGNN
ncbi:MAG: hypothetical protein V3T64_09565, partial [Myxococcota bacterium]